MGTGPAPKINDWKAVEPDDWQTVPQGAPAPRAGFGERFGVASGIPTTWKDAGAMLNPMNYVRAIPAYVKGVAAEGRNLAHEYHDAKQNVETGQPVLPNVGKVGEAGLEFLNRGLLAPVGGNAFQNAGEDFHASDYPALAGDVVGLYTAALLQKGIPEKKGLPAPKIADRVVAAFPKSQAADVLEQVKAVMPDIQAAVAKHGAPRSPADFAELTQRINSDLDTERNVALQQIRNKKTVPTQVADALRNAARDIPADAPNSQGERAALLHEATKYEKPMSYGALDHERAMTNARLTAYRKKGDLAQYAAGRASIGTRIDDIVGDSIRDTVYPEMDRATGKPQGYFRNLATRQRYVKSLNEAAHDNAKSVAGGSAFSRGTPRFSRENVSMYVGSSGKPGGAAHRVGDIIRKPSPERDAASRIRSAFPAPRKVTAGKAVRALAPFRYEIESDAGNPTDDWSNPQQR